MTKTILKSAALASTVLTLGLISTAPAHALTFNQSTGSVTFTSADINQQAFQVRFDGRSDGANNIISGLTSEAFLKLKNLTSNQAILEITLKNTSGGSKITGSRVSALGFNVDPNLSSASVASGGLFEYAVTGSQFPNGFGNIEVCFIDNRNNCNGGQSGGVDFHTPSRQGVFTAFLNFNSPITQFTLSNFGVRYQSINGPGLNNDSGTGVGQVPTPALLPGLIALGAGVLRKRKGEQPAEAKVEV